jgi:hypothetical protein
MAWNAANTAWDAFISKEAVAVDLFRDGMSYGKNVVETNHIAKKTKQRASDLDALFTYVPAACGGDGARDLAQSFAAWRATFEPADKHLTTESERAWEAFRASETALYIEVHGAAGNVGCDVSAMLAKARTRELTDLVSDASP